MTLRLGILIIIFAAFAGQADAQSVAAAEFLEAAASKETSADIARLLDDTLPPQASTVLWREALAQGRSDNKDRPEGRAAVVRLMEAAALIDGVAVAQGSLDRFGRDDLEALQAAIGLPGEADLLRYLFARPISLLDQFEFERYSIVRTVDPQFGLHLIRERTSIPYLDLSPTFSVMLMEAADDPIPVVPGEFGKTRHLNLAAAGDLVVAARAYAAAAKLDGAPRAYARLVAYDAVERATRANPMDFRFAPYRAHWAALRSLRSASNDDFLKQERLQREMESARVAFFARQFSEAAETDVDIDASSDATDSLIWSSWGEIAVALADGLPVGDAATRLVDQLTSETSDHARSLMAMLRGLSPDDPSSSDLDLESVRRLSAYISVGAHELDDDSWLAFHQNFLRMLEAMGRPDIAVRYMMHEIDGLSTQRSLTWRETQMLIWLAPFVVDLCGFVSFEMSPAREWQLRPTPGYNRYLDFLHSVSDDGRPTRPGEIFTVLDEPGPYGATSPEEDCTTILPAFGVTRTGLSGLSEASTIEDAIRMTGNVERWAESALLRNNQAPSAAPFLKVLWIGWFGEAFQQLGQLGFRASNYEYIPFDVIELTSPNTVREWQQHASLSPHHGFMLSLFIDLRGFLERRYP